MRKNGKCLGSGPALHPGCEHVQTHVWGLGKYRVLSVKGCSEAKGSAVLGEQAAGLQLCWGALQS